MTGNGGHKLLYYLATCLMLLFIIPAKVNGQCAYTTKPEQLHLALRPGGMTVSWITPGYMRDTDTPTRKVLYGTEKNALTSSSTVGFSSSYYPEVGWRYFFHNVFLDNLQPSTTYYYQIAESTRCCNASDVRSFKTGPVAGSNPNQAFRFTVIGDVSVNQIYNISESQNTFKSLPLQIPDSGFLLFVGDLGYADFYTTWDANMHDYERVLNEFGQYMEPIASYLPVQVVPGNHEPTCDLTNGTGCPYFLKGFNAYLNRYWMSGDLSGGYKNLWYSFDYGSMHVIMLNMETDFPNAPAGPGSAIDQAFIMGSGTQVGWFLSDIVKANATAQRAKYPWIIVGGHRAFGGSEAVVSGPPSKTGKRTLLKSFCVACRTAFMLYFYEYYIDFYFTGHIHWAELLYPLDGSGEVISKDFTSGLGWIHSTQGMGGPPNGASKINYVEGNVSSWITNETSYQNVYIQNSTHARLEMIASVNTSVIKTVQVVRRR